MSSSAPYIGSKISLVSNSDIRYEGTLYTINTQESTIALQSVQCCGTEGRKKPEIMPSSEIYDFIIFRGQDIKDLTVLETANHLSDPAIMSVNQRPAGGPGKSGGKGKDSGGGWGASGGKDLWGGGGGSDSWGGSRGGGDAWGGKGSGSAGGGKDSWGGGGKAWGGGSSGGAWGGAGGGSAWGGGGKDYRSSGGKGGGASGGYSAWGGVASKGGKTQKGGETSKGGAKGGGKDKGGKAMAGGKDAKGGKGKGGDGKSGGKSGGRRGGGESGGATIGELLPSVNEAEKAKFATEFDYEAATKGFDKNVNEDDVEEKLKPRAGYDKVKSFFDNISCEATDRAGEAERPKMDRNKARQNDVETFGDTRRPPRPAGQRRGGKGQRSWAR